jgi:hypothetical protein
MFKKRGLFDFVLAGLFAFFLVCLFLRIGGAFTTTVYTDKEIAAQMADEDFDGSLLKLNTINKLMAYCDSFYGANSTTRTYPGIVSEVIRKRFYHGYSYYNIGNNPLGEFLEPLVGNGATAIVIPDDILESPHAACSQQSIVGMEIFRRKGIPVRKVTMYDSVVKTGHFTYEVYFDNGWHFFDPDREPDQTILKKYNYPSIAVLKKNPEIVAAAYRKRDIASFQRLISNSKVGPVNKFPAPNAYFYQVTTKFFTIFGWAFIWLFILVRNRIRRKKMRVVSKLANPDYKEYDPVLSYTFGMKTGASSL